MQPASIFICSAAPTNPTSFNYFMYGDRVFDICFSVHVSPLFRGNNLTGRKTCMLYIDSSGFRPHGTKLSVGHVFTKISTLV